eukprot:Hpha_TRINITY_DN13853_c0_g1::TRINITY_DN13853_c0_g1_i2::g.70099::m.70099
MHICQFPSRFLEWERALQEQQCCSLVGFDSLCSHGAVALLLRRQPEPLLGAGRPLVGREGEGHHTEDSHQGQVQRAGGCDVLGDHGLHGGGGHVVAGLVEPREDLVEQLAVLALPAAHVRLTEAAGAEAGLGDASDLADILREGLEGGDDLLGVGLEALLEGLLALVADTLTHNADGTKEGLVEVGRLQGARGAARSLLHDDGPGEDVLLGGDTVLDPAALLVQVVDEVTDGHTIREHTGGELALKVALGPRRAHEELLELVVAGLHSEGQCAAVIHSVVCQFVGVSAGALEAPLQEVLRRRAPHGRGCEEQGSGEGAHFCCF